MKSSASTNISSTTKGLREGGRNVLGDFEDSEQSERSENREAKRARLERRPDNFENRAADDDAIEAVERRLKVDPRAQCVHFDEHLRHEQTQEGKFSVICRQTTAYHKMDRQMCKKKTKRKTYTRTRSAMAADCSVPLPRKPC